MKDFRNMTGLEVFEAVIRGECPAPAIATAIPMRFAAAEHGYIRLIARADAHHLNTYGLVHGGFAATVLDTAGACAIQATLEAGVGSSTIDLHVKYLRPVPREMDLVAEGRVLNLSRRLGLAEATLKDEAGRLLATASLTSMILRD